MINPASAAHKALEIRMANNKIGFYAGETITGTIMVNMDSPKLGQENQALKLSLTLHGGEMISCEGSEVETIVHLIFDIAELQPS